MRKHGGLIILFIILFSSTTFLYCDAYYGSDEDSVEITLPRMVNGMVVKNGSAYVGHETIRYSNRYVTVNINRPVVSLPDQAVTEKINQKVKETIDRFEEEIVSQSKKDNIFNEENKLDTVQYVVNVNNTVEYNEGGILSIVMQLYSYTGGAHGVTTVLPLNFDLDTGNAGVLEDFLGDSSNYNDIIINFIRKEVEKKPGIYFEDSVAKYDHVPYNQKFFLTPEGVTIVFDEYQIAPYAAGTVEFKIPYSEFPSGLLDNIDVQGEVAKIIPLKEEKSGKINTYLTYPSIEGLDDSEKEESINKYFKGQVDDFVTFMIGKNSNERNMNLKGITTYYSAIYYDKNLIKIYITYSAFNNKDEQILTHTKAYSVNLEEGSVKIE